MAGGNGGVKEKEKKKNLPQREELKCTQEKRQRLRIESKAAKKKKKNGEQKMKADRRKVSSQILDSPCPVTLVGDGDEEMEVKQFQMVLQ